MAMAPTYSDGTPTESARFERLQAEVKSLSDELATFLDQADRRDPRFKHAAAHRLEDAVKSLSGMHARSS